MSDIKDLWDYVIMENIYQLGIALQLVGIRSSTEEFSRRIEDCKKLAESLGLKEKWDKFINEELYKTTHLFDYFENTFKEIQHLYEQGGPDFVLKGLNVFLHRMFKRQPDLPAKILSLTDLNRSLFAEMRKSPKVFSDIIGVLEAIGLGAAATFVKRCLERSDQHNIQIMEEEWNKADEILRLYLDGIAHEPLIVLAVVEDFFQWGPLPGDSDFLPAVKREIDLIVKNCARITYPPY